MGEPNNVLKAYMKKPDRIRSVLEYFLGGKLPRDWAVETKDGFYTVKNQKGKNILSGKGYYDQNPGRGF